MSEQRIKWGDATPLKEKKQARIVWGGADTTEAGCKIVRLADERSGSDKIKDAISAAFGLRRDRNGKLVEERGLGVALKQLKKHEEVIAIESKKPQQEPGEPENQRHALQTPVAPSEAKSMGEVDENSEQRGYLLRFIRKINNISTTFGETDLDNEHIDNIIGENFQAENIKLRKAIRGINYKDLTLEDLKYLLDVTTTARKNILSMRGIYEKSVFYDFDRDDGILHKIQSVIVSFEITLEKAMKNYGKEESPAGDLIEEGGLVLG